MGPRSHQLSFPSGAMDSFPSCMHKKTEQKYTNHHQPRISATRLLGMGNIAYVGCVEYLAFFNTPANDF